MTTRRDFLQVMTVGAALAALGAASGDDATAALGLHADQEAVGACATGLGRLVSTFHDMGFLFRNGNKRVI